MINAKNGILMIALVWTGFALTACSGGGGGGGSTQQNFCSNPNNMNNPNFTQKCPYGLTSTQNLYGNRTTVAGFGTGTFLTSAPSDGSIGISLNRDRNAVSHWAIGNSLCSNSVDGSPVAFDCLSIVNAVLSFHIDQSDQTGLYGGYYGQQTLLGDARWRLRMTDQFGRQAISTIFEGRAVKIGNGFQIQSGSTVITAVSTGGIGVMSITVSYRAGGGPLYTLGSGTMRGI